MTITIRATKDIISPCNFEGKNHLASSLVPEWLVGTSKRFLETKLDFFILIRGPQKYLPLKEKKSSQKLTHVLGILRNKTMADKLLYIPNYDTQNEPFCILQFVVETFGNST